MPSTHTIKTLLIRLILYLQFAPFTWLFRIYYELALRSSVLLLSRIEEVRAIYVSGSLGGGRAIYGISDIDLNIFLDGSDSAALTRKIRRLFRKLKIFFPMLGSPEEKGVYFIDSFTTKYLQYPMIRHLFDPDAYLQKLIWGTDIQNSLIPDTELTPGEKRQRLFWKLRYWLEKIVIFSETSRLTDIQITHLFYKAVADVLKLAAESSFLDHSQPDCRASISHLMDSTQKETWIRLESARRANYRIQGPSSESCFELFMHLLKSCLESASEDPADSYSLNWRFIPKSGHSDSKLGSDWIEEIQKICGNQTEIDIRSFCYVPVSSLDPAYLGRNACLIKPPSRLSLSQVHYLRSLFRNRISETPVLLVQESDCFVYAIHPELMEHWFYETETGWILYSCWDHSKALESAPLDSLLQRLLIQAGEIREQLEGDRFSRIDPRAGWGILFSALQRLLILNSIRELLQLPSEVLEKSVGPDASNDPELERHLKEFSHVGNQGQRRIRIPCDPIAICNHIEEFGPVPESILEEIRNAAQDWTARENIARRPRNGTLLLEQLLSVALGQKEKDCLKKIETVPIFSISVVVVTRNRQQYLSSCLHSLHRQTRLPDEIVVVDNASTDNTAGIIHSFSHRGLVRYVYEREIGIARARNAGIEASKGEIVAFLDDDAVAEKSWLANIEEVFFNCPDVGIVGGAIHTLEEERNDWVYRYHRSTYGEAVTG